MTCSIYKSQTINNNPTTIQSCLYYIVYTHAHVKVTSISNTNLGLSICAALDQH